jgi:hypothetical protein
MQDNATVLFRFKIPELASLPEAEQQKVAASCWESAEVQLAWRRYCSRPIQWPLFPVLPIAIYDAIANVSLVRALLIVLPIVCAGVFILHLYYKRQLISVIRSSVSSRLPPNKSLQPTPGGASVRNLHLSPRVAEL